MSSIDKSKIIVTDAINAFFSSPNMKCQILNMTEPQNTNKDNEIKFAIFFKSFSVYNIYVSKYKEDSIQLMP